MRPKFRRFDVVCFSYGYTKRRMTFECKGITIADWPPGVGRAGLQNIHHQIGGSTTMNKEIKFRGKRPTYVASCSFGKDSIATILLALEHGEPLDLVVFSEVMFDHERGISGEIPEHIEWIYGTAIPKLRDMGIHVDVVRAERDYRYFFVNAVGGALCRANLRLPDWRQMFHQSRLQSRANS